jgi:CDP-paratose 2-epimerase
MKVLVTGGCGFIGVHACEFFSRQGWAVIAYDNMTKFELDRTGYRAAAARDYNWNWLGELGVERVIGDIRDLEQILDCSSGCDFIVHTAAQPAVTISIRSRWLI